jgi:hypothetical protein
LWAVSVCADVLKFAKSPKPDALADVRPARPYPWDKALCKSPTGTTHVFSSSGQPFFPFGQGGSSNHPCITAIERQKHQDKNTEKSE